MEKFTALLLCSTLWWLALTNTARGENAFSSAPANSNVAPEYKGPEALRHIAGTELKIEKTMPISIHDPDNNLEKVNLEVKYGTLSVTGTEKAIITGPNTHQMTLSGPELDINKTLKTLTYKNNPDFVTGEDKLIVNASDKANKMMEKRTIPITVTQENAASKVCDPTKTTSGGAQGFWGNLSAGPTLSYSLVQYNLADKKSSLNAQAAGAGISIRYYGNDQLANFGAKYLERERKPKVGPGEPNKIYAEDTDITDVPSGCRAQTYEFYNEEKIHSWISVSPTMYAFQEKNADNFGVQFAFNIGFLDDIFTIGAGWNLSGDNAGEWFILAGPSIGFGF
jgi:hypothetical protein